jgi:hypothetical protein
MRYFLICVAVMLSAHASAAQYADIPWEKIMTPEQQRAAGIPKLSETEREKLRIFIIETYIKGFESGKKEASKGMRTPDVIESQIDGDFEGWEGETIVKLMNGQIWQQLEYYYVYHYAFMPRVLIYKSGRVYKMKVEGVDKAVGVMQLR